MRLQSQRSETFEISSRSMMPLCARASSTSSAMRAAGLAGRRTGPADIAKDGDMTKTTVAAVKPAFYLSILLLGAITLWVGDAHAQSMERAPLVMPVLIGDGPGMLIPVVLQAAELTDDQGAAVGKVLEKEGPPMRDLLKALQHANLELAERTFRAESPRPSDIAAPLRRITDLRDQLMKREMAMLLHIRAVLKPEQLAHIEKVNKAVIDDFSHSGASPFAGATPIE
jgi:hypothetical protein